MADIYENTPLAAQEQAIKRRQQIAASLMAQGQSPIENNRMAGVYVAPVSPLEAIGKLAQAYFGDKREKEANTEYEGLAKQRQQAVADELAKYQQTAQGSAGVEGIQAQPERTIQAPAPLQQDQAAPNYNTVPEQVPAVAGREAVPAVAANPRAAVTQAMMSQYPELQRFAAVEMNNQNRKEDLASTQAARAQEAQLAREARAQELELRLQDARTSNADRLAMQKELAVMNHDTQVAIANQASEDRRFAVNNRATEAPIQITDAAGNVKLVDRQGNLVKDLGGIGKPSAGFEKANAAKKKMTGDLDTTISELENATKDGGLIDQSTGSGAGALVDMAAGFVGKATPGSVAAGRMQPIFDMALKMVPRFEGPQSDKDTASYKEAAGNLANPRIPNATKKAAGKEILRLMKQRKGQFISNDIAGTEADIQQPSAPRVVDW